MNSQDGEKKKLADLSIVGLMFPVSIVVGGALGYILDQWLHTAPYLLIVLTLYGVVAGFYNFYRTVKKYDAK